MKNPANRTNPQQDLQVVVERILPARRARVYRAWIDPVLMEKWFAPMDKKAVSVEANVTVGGRYRIGMRGQDGAVDYVSGRYLEIQPPERLVFTWTWETEPPSEDSIVTVEFFEQGDSTRLVLTHQKLTTPQSRDSHRRGWESCLEHLETNLLNGNIQTQ
jgi:uncharacterized protein YndB with AHSA1/START domain